MAARGQQAQLSAGSFSSEQYTFSCKIDSAKTISNILQCLNCKKDTWATVILRSSGVKFIVEEHKVMQLFVNLKMEIFQEYRFDGGNDIMMQVHLSNLIDCLNMYGGEKHSTTLHMSYPGLDGSLILTLTEGDVVTDCSMKARPADPPLDFRFADSLAKSNRIIVRSDVLRDAINELEWISESIWIHFARQEEDQVSGDYAPLFISAKGTPGELEIRFLRDQSDQEAYFSVECNQNMQNKYKLSLLQRAAAKALSHSERTSIRMNERGTLSLQHMVRLDGGSGATAPTGTTVHHVVVESYMCSQVHDDDEDDEDDSSRAMSATPMSEDQTPTPSSDQQQNEGEEEEDEEATR